MKKLTMKNLPISERPYEKLLNYGVDSLSDSELLAIIIKSGTRGLTAIDVAQRILILNDNKIGNISNLEIEQLKKVEGIGIVKAVQIKAVLELAKRIARPNIQEIKKIGNSKDVYNLLRYECINETKEKIFVVNLNIKCEVIKVSRIASGGQVKVSINIKELFSEAIKLDSNAIILVHNHPSGDTKPSKSDIEFTFKAIEAGKILNIEVLDHIIISDYKYTSLKESGII